MFPIEEFNARFGTDLPDEDFHTIAGLRLRPARPGPGARRRRLLRRPAFDVLEVEGNRIERLVVTFFERPQPRSRELVEDDELE